MKSMKNKYLGIEITDNIIRAVSIIKTLTKTEIISSIEIPINFCSLDIGDLSRLKKFILKNSIGTNKVAVGIPYNWQICKFIDIPVTEKDRIYQLLQFELEKHIPFSKDDVYYGFQIIKEINNIYTILVSIIEKERLGKIISILKAVNVNPSIVSPSMFHIAEIARVAYKDILNKSAYSSVVLFEENYITTMIIENNRPVDMWHIVLDKENTMEVAFYKIYDEKFAVGTRYAGAKLIFLGNKKKSMFISFEKKYGIKAILADDFSRWIKNANDYNFFAAIGAVKSLRGINKIANINLLSQVEDTGKNNIYSLLTKIFLIVSILLSLIWAFSEITNEKKELSLIENEIKKQTPNIKIVEKLLSELATIENNKKYLLNIKQNNISKVRIIAELSRIMPKNGWIIIFYYQEKENNEMAIGQVTIKGLAKIASKILPEIEKSSIFEKAEFIEPIIKKPEGELFNIRFDVVSSKKSSIKTSIEKDNRD